MGSHSTKDATSSIAHTAQKIHLMVVVANCAIELDAYEANVSTKKQVLREAYADWKETRGIARIERDSDEWKAMMGDTHGAYQNLVYAKKNEANARRRLKTAVRNFRNCN
ncbi:MULTISPECIES: hypothetical protein [Rhizobium]|uniref:hypothetical protein n=1 Tax=Rhizobium TaxID=379 RepID=UPI001C83C3E3|nr:MULTISPECIES: hypothetical protein [Rhizobium]MBX4952076.1 hypothetical protein [Rhizobium binae]MBX5226855.1 hypothetical protein [Rhizobium sp. NLR9b]MBX5238177.1 hypothetical protein [Rhizobium sp. NLR22b]MBX5287526.1 hypothetical protein [Rhizobium sp. NLR10b]MBX5305342.1 hypothetical protein [Rhizobium sp. NLR14b]